MLPPARHVQTPQEIIDFEVRYWFEVDHNYGRLAPAFYTSDGRFEIGERNWAGPDDIASFYTERERLGPRTARHVVSNFIVLEQADAEVRYQCILTLTAVDGVPPLPIELPVQVADVVADAVRLHDGSWRFRSHRLIPVFVGKAIPSFADKQT